MTEKQKFEVVFPVIIQVNLGATVNIGNYESRKISFGVSLPISSAKEIDAYVEKLKKYLKKKIDDEVEKIKAEHGQADVNVVYENLDI